MTFGGCAEMCVVDAAWLAKSALGWWQPNSLGCRAGRLKRDEHAGFVSHRLTIPQTIGSSKRLLPHDRQDMQIEVEYRLEAETKCPGIVTFAGIGLR
jgi:hypothetical protein